jgi:hypothetical protein
VYIEYITDRTRFATKSERKKTSQNSYQVSHLHMSHDTVQLAQLNRKAKDLLAQKENSEFVIRLKTFVQSERRLLTQRFFEFARRGPSEGGSMYKTCDRLNEDHNKAKTKKIKSKECFGLYGQATKRI